MSVVVTRETGARAKPVGLLTIEEELQVVDGGSTTELADSGLDAVFVADLLSACLAHERCGVHLYRAVAARSTIDELRRQYERFGDETLEHVRLLEELIEGAGGDSQYVSPAARATEKAGAGLVESTFVLDGSIDPDTAELAMLEAVMLAEAKDQHNWQLLALLASQMSGDLRAQFRAVTAEVLAQEDEHFGWARAMRGAMLADLAGAATADELYEADGLDAVDGTVDLSSMTRDELYETAKQKDIPGRSQMNKSELAEAIAEFDEEG